MIWIIIFWAKTQLSAFYALFNWDCESTIIWKSNLQVATFILKQFTGTGRIGLLWACDRRARCQQHSEHTATEPAGRKNVNKVAWCFNCCPSLCRKKTPQSETSVTWGYFFGLYSIFVSLFFHAFSEMDWKQHYEEWVSEDGASFTFTGNSFLMTPFGNTTLSVWEYFSTKRPCFCE